eukprot:Amastigsp_a841062_1667.p3 type:complete len:126 gc:universal Amastigsp_a841062_1667:687-1064(+)
MFVSVTSALPGAQSVLNSDGMISCKVSENSKKSLSWWTLGMTASHALAVDASEGFTIASRISSPQPVYETSCPRMALERSMTLCTWLKTASSSAFCGRAFAKSTKTSTGLGEFWNLERSLPISSL